MSPGRMSVIRIIFALLAVCVAGGTSFAAESFRASLLAEMAQSMGLTDTILRLDDGDHVAALSYKSKPITVSVRNGKVTHIGYSVFTGPHRQAAYSPAFDVVERLALVDVLKVDRRSATRMLNDVGGSFRKGSFSALPALYADSLVSVSVRNIDGKAYRILWSRNDKNIVDLVIPYTYSLIHGTEMEEDEENLIEDLQRVIAAADSSMFVPASVTRDDLVSLFPTGYYLLPGDVYYFDSFNSNRYYTKVDSVSFAPIYDERFPIESMANVATSMEVPNDLTASVKIVRYNYNNTTLDMPLSALVKYCLDNGCNPYFGVIGRYDDRIEFEVLMRNDREGYCHLIKLVANTPEDKPFFLTARMNPYIPISKIQSLFADDESAWESSHKNKIKYRQK